MDMDMDIVMDACRVVPYRFESYVFVFVNVAFVSFKHVIIPYHCVEIGSICNGGHNIMTLMWHSHGYTRCTCSEINELNYRYEHGEEAEKIHKIK